LVDACVAGLGNDQQGQQLREVDGSISARSHDLHRAS
jgi:hypothetical protein